MTVSITSNSFRPFGQDTRRSRPWGCQVNTRYCTYEMEGGKLSIQYLIQQDNLSCDVLVGSDARNTNPSSAIALR